MKRKNMTVVMLALVALMISISFTSTTASAAGGNPVPVPVNGSNMSGGYSFPDLRVGWYASESTDSEGVAGVSVTAYVDAQYRVETVGNYFYTDWNNATLFHWDCKIVIDYGQSPSASDAMYSWSPMTRIDPITKMSRTINTGQGISFSYNSDENGNLVALWDYGYANLYLTDATITSANFYWEDSYPEWRPTGYGVGKLELSGILNGPGALQFGQMFQAVPEPATISLLAIGAIALIRRRRRS